MKSPSKARKKDAEQMKAFYSPQLTEENLSVIEEQEVRSAQIRDELFSFKNSQESTHFDLDGPFASMSIQSPAKLEAKAEQHDVPSFSQNSQSEIGQLFDLKPSQLPKNKEDDVIPKKHLPPHLDSYENLTMTKDQFEELVTNYYKKEGYKDGQVSP